MSKEISDVLGRISGDMIALQGLASRLAAPPPTGQLTVEQMNATLAPPLLKATREEYEYVKKLAEEIKGFCATLEELVDKELKVPPPPEASSAPPSSSAGA